MYESRQQRPLARSRFLRRLAMHAGVVLVLIGVSLFGGMLGYMAFEGMSRIDAFLNAAMLLGGMGPVGELHTDAGKLFAGLFALYSGMVFLAAAALLFAPLLHRIMHRFHWLEEQHGR